MHRLVRWPVFLVAPLVVSTPAAYALTINTTFDSTVTSLANSAQWMSAWNYAARQIQSLYSDAITINMTLVAGGTGSSTLGMSNPQLEPIGSFDTVSSGYAAMRSILLADSKTANDATAYANLPVADPTGGRLFGVTYANAKALGIRPSNDLAMDGSVAMSTTVAWTFDPNNRSVRNAYDFIGVVQHEITEVMGRIGFLGQGQQQFGFPFDSPIDLFGYSSPGNLNQNTHQQGVYFSIDGGVTSLRIYNNGSNGGDDKDWASGQNPAFDSFNAFTGSGNTSPLSLVDEESMDVIGYDLVPEPSAVSLAGFGFVALAVLGWRKQFFRTATA
jgi:hypothetical protein